MSEERQRQRMTEWASLFLAPGETIRVVTPGTFCDSAAGLARSPPHRSSVPHA